MPATKLFTCVYIFYPLVFLLDKNVFFMDLFMLRWFPRTAVSLAREGETDADHYLTL